MSERISNERLREIAAFTGKRHPWPYVEQMANELLALRASHEELKRALKASLPIILQFVARNPKWATPDGSLQDPMGSHGLLPQVNDALENARKVMG